MALSQQKSELWVIFITAVRIRKCVLRDSFFRILIEASHIIAEIQLTRASGSL